MIVLRDRIAVMFRCIVGRVIGTALLRIVSGTIDLANRDGLFEL